MINFLYPSPSITNNNQTPSNSNYISPSNTDSNVKPGDSATSSILSFICCAIFINYFLPFTIELIRYYNSGPPQYYELL